MAALIGADPELFVKNADDVVIPIFDLVGGTKLAPTPFEGYDGYFYQEDGAALEFNIPPQTSSERFQRSIDFAMSRLELTQLTPRKLKFARGTNAIKLSSFDRAHRKAGEIGCLADHHAYAIDLPGFQRQPFTAEALGDMRYAGGHLHVAYNKEVMPEFAFAQFMDIFVGLPSVMYDKQGGRRPIYGRAGLYRPKPYGIEYRTLSNYWLFQSTDLKRQMAGAAISLANNTWDTQYCEDVFKTMYPTIPWQDVALAIDTEDEKLARKLINFLGTDLGVYTWG